jgi:hypothetical protein
MSRWELVITGDGEARDAEGRLLDAEGNVAEPGEAQEKNNSGSESVTNSPG